MHTHTQARRGGKKRGQTPRANYESRASFLFEEVERRDAQWERRELATAWEALEKVRWIGEQRAEFLSTLGYGPPRLGNQQLLRDVVGTVRELVDRYGDPAQRAEELGPLLPDPPHLLEGLPRGRQLPALPLRIATLRLLKEEASARLGVRPVVGTVRGLVDRYGDPALRASFAPAPAAASHGSAPDSPSRT
jgi:hypothetical protein